MKTDILRVSAFLLSFGAAALPFQALAADLDTPEPSIMTPVEYGSGWYLRGDIGGVYKSEGALTF